MPVCHVCSGEDFEIHGGLFYCTECNTQSQEVHEEEEDEERLQSVGGAGSLVIQSSKKKKRGKKVDLGNPWVTTEGFNILIQKQVMALINLGASTQLKDVVLQLWAFYLKKCEIAFWETSAENIPLLGTIPRSRDIQVLCGNEKIKRLYSISQYRGKMSINNRKRKSTPKGKKRKRNLKDRILSKETKEASSEIESATDKSSKGSGYISDSECSIKSSKSESSVMSLKSENSIYFTPRKKSEIKYSSLGKSLQREKRMKTCKQLHFQLREKVIDFMTVSKTLCFPFLGLLLLEDQILLSDMIRFTKEGYLPYMDSTHHFPSSMKLQQNDWSTMTPIAPPKMKKICDLSYELAKFIKIPEIKHRSLLPIVIRFIKDLNLPDELVCVTRRLLENFLFPTSWYPCECSSLLSSIPMYEVQAMAYILVTLKMLFGLDEKTEKIISRTAKKFGEIINGYPMFVWDEWIENAKLKEEFLKSKNIPYSHIENMTGLDVDSLSSLYYRVLQCWRHKEPYQKYQKNYRRPAYRNALKKTFTDLVNESNVNVPPCPASSFPLTSSIHSQVSQVHISHQYLATQNSPLGNLLKDFSSYSLSYLIDPYRLEQYIKQHSRNGSIDVQKFEVLMSELPFSYLCNQHKVNKDDKNAAMDKKDILNCNSSANYWSLTCPKKNVHNFLDFLPETFLWLLQFTSKLIECKPAELYYAVLEIERNVLKINNIVNVKNIAETCR